MSLFSKKVENELLEVLERNDEVNIFFTEEFAVCLDKIQDFFAYQDYDVLRWWYQNEDEIIDYIFDSLSIHPYIVWKCKAGPLKVSGN